MRLVIGTGMLVSRNLGEPYGPGAPGFGVVGAAVVGFLLLLLLAAARIARSECRLRRLWATVRDVAANSRAASWARIRIKGRGLARRLPPFEVAGVALLAGSAVTVAMAVGFTEVLEDVLEGDGIAGIDQPAAEWLATHRDLWLTAMLKGFTGAGGPLPLVVLASLTCAAAVWRCKSWLPVTLTLVGVGGVALVIVTAKALVVRNRPALPFAVIAEDGYSFPSGHATGTAAIALLCAWMLTRWVIASWTGRVIVWTAAAALSAVIGFSRVYLGVHYASDVLAGWLLGTTWAGIVVIVGSWWDNTRRARAAEPVRGGSTA